MSAMQILGTTGTQSGAWGEDKDSTGKWCLAGIYYIHAETLISQLICFLCTFTIQCLPAQVAYSFCAEIREYHDCMIYRKQKFIFLCFSRLRSPRSGLGNWLGLSVAFSGGRRQGNIKTMNSVWLWVEECKTELLSSCLVTALTWALFQGSHP